MKSFHSNLFLTFVAFILTAAISAKAVVTLPASIAGRTIIINVLSGAAPFTTKGSFRFVGSDTTNNYALVKFSGTGAVGHGVYSYNQTNVTTAQIVSSNVLTGFVNTTTNLTFTSDTAGTFFTSNASHPGAFQAGTFSISEATAPASIQGYTFKMTIQDGIAPFAASGLATLTASSAAGNAFHVVGKITTVANPMGIYTYTPDVSGASSATLHDTVSGLTLVQTLSWNSPTGGAFLIENGGNFQAGTFTATPPPPPLCTTSAATSVTKTGAILNGTINPEGSDTIVGFQYGPTTAYGTTTMPSVHVGSGIATIKFSIPVTVVAQTTVATYHYRAVSLSIGGVVFGADKTFTAPATAGVVASPQVALGAASSEVRMTVNPAGSPMSVSFDYGTTTAYGSSTPTQNLGSGLNPVNVLALFTGLLPNTTYHYRLVMVSAAGTVDGPDQTFTTLGFETSVVAQMGDAATGTPSTFASFGPPATSLDDTVAFLAKLAPTGGVTSANDTGIWIDSGVLQLIARTGSNAPGTANNFLTLSDPAFCDNDTVAFQATLSGAPSTAASGIWSNNNTGSLRLVALQGSAAPGVAGGTFASFTSLGLTNTAGAVIFATLNPTANITPANNSGIWEGDTTGNLTLMLRLGQTVQYQPLTGPILDKIISKLTFMPAEMYVNGQDRGFDQSGDLVCGAAFNDKTTGIVEVLSGTPFVTALSGAPTDGVPGTLYTAFGNPAINDNGLVAYTATFTSGVGGVTTSNNLGIFADDDLDIRTLIARSGTTFAPGTEAPFLAFSDPVYNDNEAVAFRATLKAVAGQSTPASGIWCTDGSDGSLALVAAAGGQAPGFPVGATFKDFTELALQDQGGPTNLGGVIFLATLNTNATAGVTTTSNLGIWAVDSTGALQLIVRTGDILNGKTVTGLSFLPSPATVNGQSRSFVRETGDLVYLATFSDKSTAIFGVVFP